MKNGERRVMKPKKEANCCVDLESGPTAPSPSLRHDRRRIRHEAASGERVRVAPRGGHAEGGERGCRPLLDRGGGVARERDGDAPGLEGPHSLGDELGGVEGVRPVTGDFHLQGKSKEAIFSCHNRDPSTMRCPPMLSVSGKSRYWYT